MGHNILVTAFFFIYLALNAYVIADPALPTQVSLTKKMKSLMETICLEIIMAWPPYQNKHQNVLVLVNAIAFTTEVFNPKLQDKVNVDVNTNNNVAMSLIT